MATLASMQSDSGVEERERRNRNAWRNLGWAMGQSAVAALLSALTSAATTKAIAYAGGPSSLAIYATLQQIRQAGVSAATGNGQTALVQGASSLEGIARREFVRSAVGVFGVLTAAVVLALWCAPILSVNLALFSNYGSGLIREMALPVALSAAYVFLSAILAAKGRIGTLAILQIVSPVALAGIVGLRVWSGPEDPIDSAFLAEALALASAISLAGAATALCRNRTLWSTWFEGPGRWCTSEALRRLFSVSGAMLLTGLLCSAVLFDVRGRILRLSGVESLGQFDAAWGISMNHAALVLSSMQTYCLPRLARITRVEDRNRELSRLLIAAAGAGGLIVSLVVVLKPWLLGVLYSASFEPALTSLRWTLLGDYLKITSWVLALVLLASADMVAFLVADLAAYGSFAGSHAWLANWIDPAAAGGAAFLCMYAVHLLVCLLRLRMRYAFRPTRKAVLCWVSSACLVITVSALRWQH